MDGDDYMVTILGSTGSIGTQTLDVIRSLGDIKVSALSGNKNIDLLEQQILEFMPQQVAVMEPEYAELLHKRVSHLDVEVVCGIQGLIKISTMRDTSIVVNALVGNVGLIPTTEAIKAHKNVALANKETLVAAGQLVMQLARENNVMIFPIDSEHSALYQCLRGNDSKEVEKIHLTASGGPFLGKRREDLKDVTIADALAHPNWSMGKKITIDSATMMNKGLEVIEAKWLFDMPIEKINVIVHPQSIIHSMVEYQDGSIMAQLGAPDMRLPIQYALTCPERPKNNFSRVKFEEIKALTFEKPDMVAFPCLELAFSAIGTGGTMPAVMNAANEIAVESFLEQKIGFIDIPVLIEKVMASYNVKNDYSLSDVIEADKWAREYMLELVLCQ